MDFILILNIVTVIVLTINIVLSALHSYFMRKSKGKDLTSLRKYHNISMVVVCVLLLVKLILWPYTFASVWDYLDPILNIVLLIALAANLILDWRLKGLKARG